MDDFGEVNLFGLDDFGEPVGLKPIWGGAIGAVVANGAAIGTRMATDDPDIMKYDELIGTGAGVVASGVMMIFKGTRAASWAALLTTLGSTGLRALEKALMSAEKKAQVAASTLKGITVERVPSLQGLGLTTVEQVPTLQGPPPALVGTAMHGLAASPAAQQVPMILNGLAQSYGATYAGG